MNRIADDIAATTNTDERDIRLGVDAFLASYLRKAFGSNRSSISKPKTLPFDQSMSFWPDGKSGNRIS